MSMVVSDQGPTWTAVLVACAGIGALVDFALGKAGQARVKSVIETLWIIVSYTSAKTFGRDEARVAAKTLYAMFGTFFSYRRLLALGSVLLICCAVWLFIQKFPYDSEVRIEFFLFSAAFRVLLFSLSISITIRICEALGRYLIESPIAIILALAAFCVQYAILAIFHTLSNLLIDAFLLEAVGDALPGTTKIVTRAVLLMLAKKVTEGFALDPGLLFLNVGSTSGLLGYMLFLTQVLTILPQYLRMLLAAMFTLSCLLKPTTKVVLLLLQRLIESDKPTFTLLLGGVGAIGKAVQELAKTI